MKGVPQRWWEEVVLLLLSQVGLTTSLGEIHLLRGVRGCPERWSVDLGPCLLGIPLPEITREYWKVLWLDIFLQPKQHFNSSEN